MRLILLNRRVCKKPNVVVYIEVEQRAGLSTRFVDDEVVKSIMLWNVRTTIKEECYELQRTWGMIKSSYKNYKGNRNMYQYSYLKASNRRNRTLMYIMLSTLIPRSSGNCCRHFSKKVLIESPFLHYREFKNWQAKTTLMDVPKPTFCAHFHPNTNKWSQSLPSWVPPVFSTILDEVPLGHAFQLLLSPCLEGRTYLRRGSCPTLSFSWSLHHLV